MPEDKYATKENCNVRHRFIGRLLISFISVIGFLAIAASWSWTAGYGAQRSIDIHVAADEKGDEAIQTTLRNIETRQIRMGERIDSIYERVGR